MLPQLDQFNLHHRIAENKSPTVVLFTSGACSSCRHFKRILEQVTHRHPEWLAFEVDAQRDMALTREFEVFHLPAAFLFHRGIFHCELSCEASVAAVEAAITRALQQAPQDAP